MIGRRFDRTSSSSCARRRGSRVFLRGRRFFGFPVDLHITSRGRVKRFPYARVYTTVSFVRPSNGTVVPIRSRGPESPEDGVGFLARIRDTSPDRGRVVVVVVVVVLISFRARDRVVVSKRIAHSSGMNVIIIMTYII